MAAKTTGAEFKRFYDDPNIWPENGTIWHEEEVVTVNGADSDSDCDFATIPDDASVVIEGGVVFGPEWDENNPTFEQYFKRWRKKQTTASLLVECDISKVDAVKAAIKAAGGRVA